MRRLLTKTAIFRRRPGAHGESRFTRFATRARFGLWRDRRGSTAVEFAVIALPFFGLIMGCLELAIVLVAGVSLDLAASKVSRELRTGQSTKPTTSSAFITKVCAEMAWLGSDCTSKMRADVRTFTNFKMVTEAPNVIVNGEFTNLQYTAGGSSQIQLVRVYYPWRVVSPFMKPGLGALSSGEMVVSSTIVFRNEPF
ncbi:MAG: pilus assembly protein [Asticcacaulis sp.]|uniref:TadE/TadG family type IV pilus assembly protein n=1 Tax=Asticcacaulis sp. TaxID=1872648 RepID=UPI0025BC3549|nr:TadE/TadG family type IV pilus assembly protein [Asticcacaulis sp.]MCA1935713.1 pilus assembly protein [Asticcacaulis sp.]